jgi:hypothetical protein
VKKIVLIVLGILLALTGVVWTLQGLDLMGQSGGMNGKKIFAVIGVIVFLIGAALIAAGARTRRTPVG